MAHKITFIISYLWGFKMTAKNNKSTGLNKKITPKKQNAEWMEADYALQHAVVRGENTETLNKLRKKRDSIR